MCGDAAAFTASDLGSGRHGHAHCILKSVRGMANESLAMSMI